MNIDKPWVKILNQGFGVKIYAMKQAGFSHNEIQNLLLIPNGFSKLNKFSFYNLIQWLKKKLPNIEELAKGCDIKISATQKIELSVQESGGLQEQNHLVQATQSSQPSSVQPAIQPEIQQKITSHPLVKDFSFKISNEEKELSFQILKRNTLFCQRNDYYYYDIKESPGDVYFQNKSYKKAPTNIDNRFIYSLDERINATFELAVLQGRHVAGLVTDKPLLDTGDSIIRNDFIGTDGLIKGYENNFLAALDILLGEKCVLQYNGSEFVDTQYSITDILDKIIAKSPDALVILERSQVKNF